MFSQGICGVRLLVSLMLRLQERGVCEFTHVMLTHLVRSSCVPPERTETRRVIIASRSARSATGVVMNHSEQAQPHKGRSQSRFQQIVAPFVVLMLLGQFAPIGLLTSEGLRDACPHCTGSESHVAQAGSKCMHPGVHSGSSGHHGMSAMARHSQPQGETSFCGCGADDTSLTILPPIGKTLAVAISAIPAPHALDLAFADLHDRANAVEGSNLFHPPRLA